MIAIAIVIAVAALGIAGRLNSGRVARRIDAKYPRGADGIIVGAAPIMKPGTNGAAILLVHGGGDTPQTLAGLAEVLNTRGYTVDVPLLPGHGRDLAAFDAHSADEWYEHSRAHLAALHDSHSWVGVVGLSMGGAISARLAAETRQVDALVLASPYLTMPHIGGLIAATSWLWRRVVPVVDTSTDASVRDPAARAISLGYGAFTGRSLAGLRETARRGHAALPRVAAPTLVIQSTTDNRVTSAATRSAFSLLGATDKSIEWIEGAGHVITVDFGWEKVARLAADWMDAHRSSVPATRR